MVAIWQHLDSFLRRRETNRGNAPLPGGVAFTGAGRAMVFSLRGYFVAGKASDRAGRLGGPVHSSSSDEAPSLLKAAGRSGTPLNGDGDEQRRTLLQRELRTALIAGRIVVQYQPVSAFEDDRVIRLARAAMEQRNQVVERDQLMALAQDAGSIRNWTISY